MAEASQTTRDGIVAAAGELFYAGSIRDISVDRIAAQAGVTKKTVYYHFRSKDELVAAYLDARNRPTLERYRRWAGKGGSMADRIERMFRSLQKAAKSHEWNGCGFTRVAVELADLPGHPALDVARNHKRGFEGWLRQDLADSGYEDAGELSEMLMIILDGAITRMLVHRDPHYAAVAARAARRLLSR
ncbi:TetR/AcrR family transcriptional regulator [Pelagibius sp.]|uniref:TetR/AcrR family transcriptional regulator n=1 Tax=Pelagibius sp. TaxID=1931238 RepID=UPI003BAF64A7